MMIPMTLLYYCIRMRKCIRNLNVTAPMDIVLVWREKVTIVTVMKFMIAFG